MQIHERKSDARGAGRWDTRTGRYVPFTGGSRSRLPVTTDAAIPRYFGLVGIDEVLTPTINSISALYAQCGGGYYVPEGPEGAFIKLILEQANKWAGSAAGANGAA